MLDEIDNGVRIANATKAVEEAEKYEGDDENTRYALIRSARLRVNIIINDGPETEVIIDDLHTRLDTLEGITSGGGSGSGGGVHRAPLFRRLLRRAQEHPARRRLAQNSAV